MLPAPPGYPNPPALPAYSEIDKLHHDHCPENKHWRGSSGNYRLPIQPLLSKRVGPAAK
jgi:hypothetical protein